MADEIKAKIAAVGDEVRELKAAKQDPKSKVAELLALKAKYKEITGEDFAPPGQKKEAKKAAPAKKEPTAKELAKEAKKQEVLANQSAKAKAKDAAKAKDPPKKEATAQPAAPVSGAIAGEVQARKGTASERTYIMIKPDGVQRNLIGQIVWRFEKRGFQLVALKMAAPPRSQLEQHYADLKAKPFFAGLVEYMASGPVVCMVWEGLDAVKTGRAMLGETKPLESLPGTIRGDLCLDVGRNICHGSDSVESAESEIALWFDKAELMSGGGSCFAGWLYEAAPEPKAAAASKAPAAAARPAAQTVPKMHGIWPEGLGGWGMWAPKDATAFAARLAKAGITAAAPAAAGELQAVVRSYLALDSLDGKTDRQAMRQKLASLCNAPSQTKELEAALRSYLVLGSTDGRTERQAMRRKLAGLVGLAV